MRRIIALSLIVLFTFSVIGLTEETDSLSQSYQEMVESLDYESLLELSDVVNNEIASRPEAQPFILTYGIYLVGSDIAPGIYYFTSPEQNRDAYGCVYTSKTTYENRYDTQRSYPPGFVCEIDVEAPNTQRIILESGNLLEVLGTIVVSTDKESAENYYTYNPPEGTYVPAGIYTVGVDIPEGMYRFYSATGYKVRIRICEHGKAIETLDPTTNYETARLLDGYEIETEDDIIMTKQPSLSFE